MIPSRKSKLQERPQRVNWAKSLRWCILPWHFWIRNSSSCLDQGRAWSCRYKTTSMDKRRQRVSRRRNIKIRNEWWIFRILNRRSHPSLISNQRIPSSHQSFPCMSVQVWQRLLKFRIMDQSLGWIGLSDLGKTFTGEKQRRILDKDRWRKGVQPQFLLRWVTNSSPGTCKIALLPGLGQAQLESPNYPTRPEVSASRT